MLDLPDSLINDINVINSYFEKYNVNNYYFINKVKKLKYIENFNLDKYGMYDHSTNKITVNPTMHDDGKKVLSHELLHIAGGFNNHIGFNEFTTQYFNSVIFNAKPGHFYKEDYKMIDKMCKIVGFDNYFKTYLLRDFNLFMDILIKHLDYAKAYDLINIMDKYYSYFTNIVSRERLNKYELERDFKKIIKKAK